MLTNTQITVVCMYVRSCAFVLQNKILQRRRGDMSHLPPSLKEILHTCVCLCVCMYVMYDACIQAFVY